ncbi:MAG: serine hydrolase [Bacteroidota bacterium]
MNKAIAFLFSSLIGLQIFAQDKAQLIDEYMAKAIEEWNIPGAAICIVKDDQVILNKGYGLVDASSKKKVDEHSLFAIASNTKAFTAAALAQLVEEGKVKWDDKVRKYIPYFELYDPYVSAEFTIRDLLCHRSGLATFSGDLVWYGTNYSREEIIRKAQYLEPVSGFRSAYGYQNIMFIAAGEVVASASGMTWEAYIKEHFLSPLGMDRTVLSIKDLDNMKNVSAPHNDVEGKNIPIDWVNWDNMGPAGSIISSVNDLSFWLRMQLNKGTWKDKEFFSQASSHEMWTAHTPKKLSGFHTSNFPSKHFSAYGLGWDLYDLHGKMVVNHGGGYDGFISHTALVPEENFGFVILTNNNTYFPWAMQYHILNTFYGNEDGDAFMQTMLTYKKEDEKEKIKNEEVIKEARAKDTKPSLDLNAYEGIYRCQMYGDVVIKMNGDHLDFDFKPTDLFKGKLHHWHYDTFRLEWDQQQMLPKGMAQFILDANGQISELRIDVPNPDFDFTELKLMRVSEE